MTTQHESIGSHFAQHEKELFDCFASNALYVAGIDPRSMYGTAIRVAGLLGYCEDAFEPFDGTRLRTGENAGHPYVPGVMQYSQSDHFRGISGTIFDAAVSEQAKVELVSDLVDVASIPETLDPFRIVTARRAFSVHRARRLALQEAKTRGLVVSGHRVNVAEEMLRYDWHPGFSRRITAAAFTARALLGKPTR